MTVGHRIRPALDRPGVAVVHVGTIDTAGPAHQQDVLDAETGRRRTHPWPAGLLAFSSFATGDGRSVLVHTQWASESSLDEALGELPDGTAFRLHRVVRGGAVPEPVPPAECFPVAFFTMDGGQDGRAWVDEMLAGEEARAGSERAYPGAIAAYLYVSPDGGRVLSFSEWETEAQAVAHIEQVWADELDSGDAPGTGANYRHHLTLTAPGYPAGGTA
jgi:heme-degrading monooxygenase HmoA